MEEGDHLINAMDNERMCLAGWLKDIRPRRRRPRVLLVAPAAFDRVRMDGRGVAVAAERAAALEAEQVDVVPLADAEAQWAEGEALCLRHPQPLVISARDVAHHDVGERFGRRRHVRAAHAHQPIVTRMARAVVAGSGKLKGRLQLQWISARRWLLWLLLCCRSGLRCPHVWTAASQIFHAQLQSALHVVLCRNHVILLQVL
mmetsp:Transcript_17399/g.37599  ORF Transcript_17399/g.37599 Transcript_17399/m.37599 type:complete len:202 (+) Transcript_17399:328-933(+)